MVGVSVSSMNNLQLHNGDSLELLKSFEDESVDLVVVDPPYCINYKEWDKEDFLILSSKWLSEISRVLREGGTAWSFMGYQHICEFIYLCGEYLNVNLDNWCIWCRNKGRGSKKKLKSQREDILYMTKGKEGIVWNPLKICREVIAPYVKDGKPRGWVLDQSTGKRIRWTGAGNVFFYSAPQWNGKVEKQFHPSQKPVMLLQRLIMLSSNEGDVVLDPFMGSGSCGIASITTNRRFIGIEKDKDTFNKAKNWMMNMDIESFRGYNLWTDKMIDEYKEKFCTTDLRR